MVLYRLPFGVPSHKTEEYLNIRGKNVIKKILFYVFHQSVILFWIYPRKYTYGVDGDMSCRFVLEPLHMAGRFRRAAT
jgi:hypothetical protein